MKKIISRIAVFTLAACLCLSFVGCGEKNNTVKKSAIVGTYRFEDIEVDWADEITDDEKETARTKLREEIGDDLTDMEYFAEYVKLRKAEKENTDEIYRFDSDHTGIHTVDGVKRGFTWSETDKKVTLTEGSEKVTYEYKAGMLKRKVKEDGLVKTETFKKKD